MHCFPGRGSVVCMVLVLCQVPKGKRAGLWVTSEVRAFLALMLAWHALHLKGGETSPPREQPWLLTR